MKKSFCLFFFCLIANVFSSCSGEPFIPDRFGIHTTDLSGNNHKTLLTSSWQQMSHPRVSPDGKWLTFTRYTSKNRNGLAREEDGYEGTEILLLELETNNLRTLVAAKEGILNANSSWTPDGTSLLYVSTENERKRAWIMKYHLETGAISRIPTPEDWNVADPHNVGNQIVFPVIGKFQPLWRMNLDGTNLVQLSRPRGDSRRRWFMLAPGDYDPKFSHDGTKVAFMRLENEGDWKIWTVDISTGKETKISSDDTIDIVPDWSSDDQLMIFSHLNLKELSKMGLYYSKPDGSSRTKIPTLKGAIANHPHFFPSAGSSPSAQIVYQSMKVKELLAIP